MRFLKEKINLNNKLKRKNWWLTMKTASNMKKTNKFSLIWFWFKLSNEGMAKNLRNNDCVKIRKDKKDQLMAIKFIKQKFHI